MKPKVLVVCGPTATGKSDRAVELALTLNGEVISADSRQVYKGLDLGSGKITNSEMEGVPHHLLDVVNPKEVFTVNDFVRLGSIAISDILSRGKLPIICGGTGFYIDALIHQTKFPEADKDLKLRNDLESKSLTELQDMLRKSDSVRLKSIDIQNKVRLVRALEIIHTKGSVPLLQKELHYEVEYTYLDFPPQILKERITKRLYDRLEQGMLEEAVLLHKNGLAFERMKDLGLEYRFMAMYLCEEISHEEMCEQIILKSTQYAKRQRTWFKKYAVSDKQDKN